MSLPNEALVISFVIFKCSLHRVFRVYFVVATCTSSAKCATQHLDLASLLLTKVTCKAWLDLIDSSVILWKARIRCTSACAARSPCPTPSPRRHCSLHPAHLPLLSLPLFLDISRSAARLQKLARRLARLHNNLQDNK